jgi:hypothetical protein
LTPAAVGAGSRLDGVGHQRNDLLRWQRPLTRDGLPQTIHMADQVAEGLGA